MDALQAQMEEMRRDISLVSRRIDKMQSDFSELRKSNKRVYDSILPRVEALVAVHRGGGGAAASRVSTANGPVVVAAASASSLFLAAQSDDVDALLRLLTVGGVDSRQRDGRGDSALHVAAAAGHERAVIVLLGGVCAVDLPGHRSRTALHCACAHGHAHVVRRLLFAGANADAKDCDGDFAFLAALNAGHLHVIELLADHGAALDTADKHGNSAMVTAAKAKQWNVVKFLLQRGASAEAFQGDENAPLYCAAKEKNYPLVTSMLKQLKQKEKQMKLALTQSNDTYLACVFEDALPGFCRSKEGCESITCLAANGKVDVLRAMLDIGAEVDGFNGKGFSCLMNAAWTGKDQVLRLLLDRGASVDAVSQDASKYTALHFAAQMGHLKCVHLLLEAGAAVNIKNSQSRTPVDLAKTKETEQLLTSYSHKRKT